MNKIVKPTPTEPLSRDGGKTMNPVWDKFFADLTRALNSLL